MDKTIEPQRIPDERDFLHSLSNPLTTALALAARTQTLTDPNELKLNGQRLTKALDKIVDLLKNRRQQIKGLEN